MANLKPKTVLYRRKREEKTNYSKRLKLLLSHKPRLVVRLTNQKVIAQIVEFNIAGDKVLVGVDSSALKEFGWNYSGKNIPAAYLLGLLIGRKALEKKCNEVIFDTGFKTPLHKGKIYAFLKGVLDAGLNVPHGENLYPDDEMIRGKHIVDYAAVNKNAGQFTKYLKNNQAPAKISEVFEAVKKKIKG